MTEPKTRQAADDQEPVAGPNACAKLPPMKSGGLAKMPSVLESSRVAPKFLGPGRHKGRDESDSLSRLADFLTRRKCAEQGGRRRKTGLTNPRQLFARSRTIRRKDRAHRPWLLRPRAVAKGRSQGGPDSPVCASEKSTTHRQRLSANKRNRRADVVIVRNQCNEESNAQDGTNHGGHEKTLLRVKSGKEVLEKSRDEERNQAQAEKLHSGQSGQESGSERQGQKLLGPGDKERREWDTKKSRRTSSSGGKHHQSVKGKNAPCENRVDKVAGKESAGWCEATN